MRGKDSRTADVSHCGRITPAYAGKRSATVSSTAAAWDHPRLCGEKSLGLTVYLHVSGSPPPMRGKVWKLTFENYKERITPAYAGKRCQLEMLTRL